MTRISKEIRTTRTLNCGYRRRNGYGAVTGYDLSLHNAEDHLVIRPRNTLKSITFDRQRTQYQPGIT